MGASTSLFSVVNGVPLKEVPSGHPGQLLGLRTVMIGAEERPTRTSSYAVTEDSFETFRAPNLRGRDFLPEKYETEPPPSVILGYQLWRDLFGDDPDIIGSTVNTTEARRTVTGVAPPGFLFPDGAILRFSPPTTLQ